MPRLDLFQDPFEGVTTRLIKQRFLGKSIPEIQNLNPALPKEIQDQLTEQKKFLDKLYEKEALTKQKTQYINCWFYENRESMAMWNIYSNSDSVAIKINGRKFVDFLKHIIKLQPTYYPHHKFICGPVKYVEINPVNLSKTVKGIKYSAFKKDTSFNFEKEYRLLIVTPIADKDKNPNFHTLDLTSNFFEMLEVICHPQMEDWKFQNIDKLCRQSGVYKVNKSSIEIKI